MITKSDSIATFAAAFVAAQTMVENASKDAENPAFKQGGKAIRYADLTSVWDACRKALHMNGLSAIQSPGLVIDGKMHMQTLLLHTSGEFVCGELSIPLGKADAQGYGSAVTYARRYALGAMMGVCPEDDDGNAASQPAPRQNAPREQRAPERQQSAQQSETTPAQWAEKQIAAFEAFKAPADFEAMVKRSNDPRFTEAMERLKVTDKAAWTKVIAAEALAHQRCDDVPF